MLAPGMIRKMGKTYTDRQMTKDNRIHYQADAWSNGFIAFKEPLPKHVDLVCDDVVEHDFWQDAETNMSLDKDLTQVWPVEIRPIYDYVSNKRIVRLSNGNGMIVWLDAGYISAILKRQPTATFHVGYRNTIVAKNGQPFAMVMPMVDLDRVLLDGEWSITNNDLDAAREFDTANELMALLPARAGSKWHSIFYMGMMLEVRRSGRKGKERALHVRMAGHDATAHISLYDGRGLK